MEKPAQNIQDSFLNNARKDKIVLTIYLMSGVKLSGRIKSFDKYSLVLETNNQEQLIFKHAISTVVTQKIVALLRRQFTGGGAGNGRRSGARHRPAHAESPEARSTALHKRHAERAILVGVDWKTPSESGGATSAPRLRRVPG